VSFERAGDLGYERDAKVDDRLRCQTHEVDPLSVGLQKDLASIDRYQAHDAAHKGALAVAIGAQQHDRLTVVDRQRDPMKHSHGAIASIDIVEDDSMCQGRLSPQRYGAGFLRRPISDRLSGVENDDPTPKSALPPA
jgi:hypothetical protein